jgi:hypothetical protein
LHAEQVFTVLTNEHVLQFVAVQAVRAAVSIKYPSLGAVHSAKAEAAAAALALQVLQLAIQAITFFAFAAASLEIT